MAKSQQSVLIIDDESISRTLMSRMLERLGYRVIVARGGDAGLALYRQHAPDLVMVDLYMPETDGYEVLASIQARSQETPVIVISATDRIGDVIRALRLGAWDFIAKPVKDSVFLENTVSRALEKASLTRENRLIRERIQTIFNAVPCGIVVLDAADQTIVDVNPMAAEMIGLPAGRIIGRQSRGFIHPENPDTCTEAQQGLTCVKSEGTLLRKDGTLLPIHKTVTQVFIDHQACIIESFVDLSEHKQVQQELGARKKLQGVIEMAGAVCHEMNQPMQVVSGLCELLLMDVEETSPLCDKLKVIRDQAWQMGRITGKLMGITRYKTKEHLDDQIIDIDRASRQ